MRLKPSQILILVISALGVSSHLTPPLFGTSLPRMASEIGNSSISGYDAALVNIVNTFPIANGGWVEIWKATLDNKPYYQKYDATFAAQGTPTKIHDLTPLTFGAFRVNFWEILILFLELWSMIFYSDILNLFYWSKNEN